jgi:SNF2 family DNA or RNA helicase
MGTGKTIQSLNYLLNNKEARPSVIVCETILKQNWVNEAEKFFGETETVQEIKGFKAVEITGSIIIIDYVLFKKHKEAILNANVKIIVFDESEKLRNVKGEHITGVQMIKA